MGNRVIPMNPEDEQLPQRQPSSRTRIRDSSAWATQQRAHQAKVAAERQLLEAERESLSDQIADLLLLESAIQAGLDVLEKPDDQP